MNKFFAATQRFIKKMLREIVNSSIPKPPEVKKSPSQLGLRANGLPSTKYRRRAWMLQKESGWNPLTSYPRNKGCFCGSGNKAKRCCLPFQPRAGKIGAVKTLKENWQKLLTGHVTLPPAPGSKQDKLARYKESKKEAA